jgi:glycosyltransferase involved in cell wall biosynthesis
VLRAAWGSGTLCDAPFDAIFCGHVNLLPCAWLASMGSRAAHGRHGRSFRSPVLLVIHGIEAWRSSWWRKSHLFLKSVDAVVSVSEFTRTRFFGRRALKYKLWFTLPNCVDLLQFNPGPKQGFLLDRYLIGGRRVLLSLARLHSGERYKGIDQVLELMPRLIPEIPQLCYLVAGDGDDRPRLVSKARSLGLVVRDLAVSERARRYEHSGSGKTASAPAGPADVVFTGRIAETEKADHYRLADAFVMPGWGEGFGIVYLEALACGIPVLGSKLDASRELLEGCESAFVADPRDAEDVYQGSLRVLAARRGSVPDRIRQFSGENFIQRTHALIDRLGKPDGLTGPARKAGCQPCKRVEILRQVPFL